MRRIGERMPGMDMAIVRPDHGKYCIRRMSVHIDTVDEFWAFLLQV